jgi:DUF1009 family protein
MHTSEAGSGMSAAGSRAAGMSAVGLIAGEGRLPILVADGMRARGMRVACVGLYGCYDPALPSHCDDFRVAGVLQLGRWIRHLRRMGAHDAVMVGRVAKARFHQPFRMLRQVPDWRSVRVYYLRARHDRRSPALLAAVADELLTGGVRLIDSTTHITDHMASVGVMGSVAPSADVQRDVDFGWHVLLESSRLGIGQCIAVRDRDVLAVEAIEGTDAMIERAGSLCRAGGWTMLKTASASHDMRADVPTIGVQTVERLSRARARAIVLGAGRVILIDRPAVLAAADRAGIAVIGVQDRGRVPTSAGHTP